MKFRLFLLSLTVFFISCVNSPVFGQNGLGYVYSDTNNLYVIKVEGSHADRGYWQGRLLASRVADIIQNYIKPQFGSISFYNQVKAVVGAGNLFNIDSLYVVEAKALIDGMNAVGGNPQNLDYNDILLANCMLDIKSILQAKGGMECSSLMSWGDATAGSSLGGKSVITRHLDWIINQVLVRNQVMVIHIPTETNEQPWAEVGFAGMISVLSGFNANMAVFQHMMGDDNHHGALSGNYKPIWFTLRKSVEMSDPNQDGRNNVGDVKYCINQQPQAFADGYIISALAKSTEPHDSLIAMVAEIASVNPVITYRSNIYADSIPGDNLYTANSQIARNNSMNFCSRYNNIRNHIGSGTLLGMNDNRNLMRNYSHLSTNYQFMTYVPENGIFRISVRDNTAGYLSPEVDFNTFNMLSPTTSLNPSSCKYSTLKIYPNPAKSEIRIETLSSSFLLQIMDSSGKIVIEKQMTTNVIPIKSLPKGVYSIRVVDGKNIEAGTFIKN